MRVKPPDLDDLATYFLFDFLRQPGWVRCSTFFEGKYDRPAAGGTSSN